MKLEEINDYDFNTSNNSFSNLLKVEQKTNKNGSYDTFFNINDGIYIDGIESLPQEDVILYTCKNNDDLRFISFDYYGTIDYWWIIAKINNIENCLEPLGAGRKLKILPKQYIQYIFMMIKKSMQ